MFYAIVIPLTLFILAAALAADRYGQSHSVPAPVGRHRATREDRRGGRHALQEAQNPT